MVVKTAPGATRDSRGGHTRAASTPAPAHAPMTLPAPGYAPIPGHVPHCHRSSRDTDARPRPGKCDDPDAPARPGAGALVKSTPAAAATMSLPALSGPPSPLSATKQQKLDALLQQYRMDQLTPQQYHEAAREGFLPSRKLNFSTHPPDESPAGFFLVGGASVRAAGSTLAKARADARPTFRDRSLFFEP